MFQARLPSTFWGESILTATHLINYTPSQVLHGKTPYELLFGKKPDLDQLRVFGCLCFAHRKARDKDKFGDRSRRCIFVGYPYGKKAWSLYDLETKDFFTSRDVAFSESKFPGVDTDDYVSPPLNHYDTTVDDWLLPNIPSRGSSEPQDVSSTQQAPILPTSTIDPTTMAIPRAIPPTTDTTTTSDVVPDTTSSSVPPPIADSHIPSSPVRRSSVPTPAESSSSGTPEILGRGLGQKNSINTT